jgi:hypothetical protein
VDFGKVCLSNLRDDILCNQFHEGMPTYLITANNSKRELEESGVKEGGKVTKKLKDGKDTKDKYKDLGETVKNNQTNQDWVLPGAKYKALFTKDVNSCTPPFNDTGLITCNKWHIRGFCYEKCEQRLSHKKFDCANHKSAYDTWIKSLKAKLP